MNAQYCISWVITLKHVQWSSRVCLTWKFSSWCDDKTTICSTYVVSKKLSSQRIMGLHHTQLWRSFQAGAMYIQVLCGFVAIMGAHTHVAFNLHSFKEPAVGISSRFELTFLSPAVAYCSFSGNSMQHTWLLQQWKKYAACNRVCMEQLNCHLLYVNWFYVLI